MIGVNLGQSLEEFRALRARQALRADVLQRLVADTSSVLLTLHPRDRVARRVAVRLLGEIATLEDGDLSSIGRRAIFAELVEPLGDAFTPDAAARYDLLFAPLIQLCRRDPGGERLDQALAQFGVRSEEDLLKRKTRISRLRPFPRGGRERVRKVFALSRVTVGADVAVTSVVLTKMKLIFPNAEIVLVGSAKTEELFGGDARITFLTVPYPRHGGLRERLEAWVDVVDMLRGATKALQPGEHLVVDPDSRFTQLGLLPVTGDHRAYRFFDSRGFSSPGRGSLARLTAAWLDEVFGASERPLYPYVHLRDRDRKFAEGLRERLRSRDERPFVAVSFGVGGNPRKRISDDFEAGMLHELLAHGNLVILDKGLGEETERANCLLRAFSERGKKVVEIGEGSSASFVGAREPRCDIVAWQGGVGGFSALIGASRSYVGYDSGFQHVAAALRVPLVDIFVGAPNARFARRWRPCSRVPACVIDVDPDVVASSTAVRILLRRAVDAHRQLSRQGRSRLTRQG